MVQNLKLAKNMIKLHRRGGRSGPGIEWHQAGIKSVIFQLFLTGVFLPFWKHF